MRDEMEKLSVARFLAALQEKIKRTRPELVDSAAGEVALAPRDMVIDTSTEADRRCVACSEDGGRRMFSLAVQQSMRPNEQRLLPERTVSTILHE